MTTLATIAAPITTSPKTMTTIAAHRPTRPHDPWRIPGHRAAERPPTDPADERARPPVAAATAPMPGLALFRPWTLG